MNSFTFRLSVFAFVTAACAIAHAQSAAGSKIIIDEPITLPKQEAGRVTARVNEKPIAPEISARISSQRVGGSTVIRVNPEGAAPYTLSNQLPGIRLLRRDHDEVRVPMWQIGKF
jgi:hypothetical protein